MQKIIKKTELGNFINNLIKDYDVVAPVKDDVTKFRKINSFDEVYLNGITLVPLKKFFLPEAEEVLKFRNGQAEEKISKQKKRIIFGARKCDLNALKILDKVMFDSFYKEKRRNTILIGLFCDTPDKKCFCNSMELEDYYDLFLYPKGGNYYISIGSKKGAKLVNNLEKIKNEFVSEIKNFKVLENKNIEKNYRNSIWDEDVEKCLSCSACTVYCPTCNCFDLRDWLDIDLKTGKRVRGQASCQLKSFSRVAGGKIFREARASRFKHFVYHKIVYYKKRFNRYMCVGCGRCLRACPTKIDWVDTINLLRDEEDISRGGKNV